MKIGVMKERRAGEARVAVSPDTVKKLVALGATVAIETGAGAGANFTDEALRAAGAEIAGDAAAAVRDAELVLKVQRPLRAADGGPDELGLLKSGTVLIGMLAPFAAKAQIPDYASRGLTAFAMEFMPRITRAQAMDVLSSQSNLAGYKAVVDAAAEFGRAFPMMMTAAGTIAPARVLVMGAGVAGLQAIATARRLGAIVSATDVRPAAKEQVESLGATFVAVQDEEFRQAETAGGYAKEMSDAYKEKQAALIAETIKKQDIVITTALIPGRPAPVLVSEAMVQVDEAGLDHRRPRGRAGRQLPALRARQGLREARREAGRARQRPRPARRRRQRALCAQPARLRDAHGRQGDQEPQDQLGGRDHQGHAPHPRRQGRASGTRMIGERTSLMMVSSALINSPPPHPSPLRAGGGK